MLKTLLLLLFALTVVALGEVCLRKGMKEIGEFPIFQAGELVRALSAAVTNRTILFGVSLHFLFFICWLIVLSRLELSLALPLTSFSYVLGVFFSSYLLHEEVSATRWIGVILVVIGVLFITRS